MLWAYDYATQNLTRIATSPYGSEYTSVDWYEIGKFGYLTAVVQHPYGESGNVHLRTCDSRPLCQILQTAPHPSSALPSTAICAASICGLSVFFLEKLFSPCCVDRCVVSLASGWRRPLTHGTH